ncbi:hypothetical protein HID58_025991 [Brassica napus]|uniref:Uncharacterized protein n=1 Tax=Brassica napus TaxID=3708 RepID=A0ABQ8CMQ1_BRANA|nr:hypothetical protein HID58_025991 [Brassica napus]
MRRCQLHGAASPPLSKRHQIKRRHRLASSLLCALISRAATKSPAFSFLSAASASHETLHRLSVIELAAFVDLTLWHHFGFIAANAVILKTAPWQPNSSTKNKLLRFSKNNTKVKTMLEEHATGWGMKRDVDDSDDVERFVLTWKGHSVVFASAWVPMNRFRDDLLPSCKSDFDKLIVATVKKENISLHNALLRGLIKNVCVSNTPPLIKNGIEETSLGFNSLCNDLPKSSPRKGRTQQRFSKDCNGKSQITEVVSSSFKQQWSMEDGEEVDQLIRCWRSQPIEALFGVNLKDVIKRRRHVGTCYSSRELPGSIFKEETRRRNGGRRSRGFGWFC